MIQKKSFGKNKIYIGIYLLLLTVYFLCAWFLYYKQISLADTGMYESDTAVHISFAVKDHYYHSFAAFIYILLSFLPGPAYTISFLLSLVTVGAVHATKILAKKVFCLYSFEANDFILGFVAFAANLLMAFYVKAANTRHYIGYQSANMWHNSTYTFMKLFAVIYISFFITLYKKYKKGLTVKEWVIASVLLAITTGFKASFFTVFAPLFAVILLIDLIRGTKFSRVFAFGSTVFASFAVMFWQSFVLFGDTSESGYAISPFTALSQRGDHPKVSLVLSVMFPAIVFLFNVKDFYKDKVYYLGLFLGVIGFLQVFLLTETGARAEDSNFFWGYSIALFFLFFVSMVKMIINLFTKTSKSIIAVTAFQAVFLVWHIISGIWYFILLLTGVSYFI